MKLSIQKIGDVLKSPQERTEKFNKEHKLLTFKVGEMVLLKLLNVGRSEDNTAAKFFRYIMDLPYYPSKLVKILPLLLIHTTGKFHGSSLCKYYVKE